jgi:hypothetical protein
MKHMKQFILKLRSTPPITYSIIDLPARSAASIAVLPEQYWRCIGGHLSRHVFDVWAKAALQRVYAVLVVDPLTPPERI